MGKMEFIIGAYRKICGKMFGYRVFCKLHLCLFHLSLRGLGVLNYGNDKISGEGYLITQILPAVIQADSPVFFDVGANIGKFSDALSDCFPKAMIYAFEPHPRTYSRLKARLNSKKVQFHNVAMGKTCGQLTLYDRADREGSAYASFHKAVISEIHQKQIVDLQVAVETVDDFVEREGINHIDFIKIDTEGHELAVLEGASKLLEKGGVGCLHFEFNEMNIVSRVFFRDFRKLLHRYELYRLLPNGLLPLGDSPLETELFAYQNILALPKKKSKNIQAFSA